MSRTDGSAGGSRPSQTNRQADAHPGELPESGVDPADLYGRTGLRPLSVDETELRPEAVAVETEEGYTIPVSDPDDVPAGTPKSRPWYRVVDEWRDWYEGYEQSHIEFEREDGKTVRTQLVNSYQPEYGDRYYAKLKDLERAVERQYDTLTTVMLTFSASTLNDHGNPRCPADHMREIADGWNTARKQLYHVLSDHRWEYAKVWEPTSEDGHGPAGYGHCHVALFVEASEEELSSGSFHPVMRSYVDEVRAAGWEAHRPSGNAVSVSYSLENLGSYVSEYIGNYGERAVDREMKEQQFHAVTWATRTQRVTFSNGANELIRGEKFRRETGLRPEDRGGENSEEQDTEPRDGTEWLETDGADDGHEWEVRRLCSVPTHTPVYSDPSSGGVPSITVPARAGDPPPDRK